MNHLLVDPHVGQPQVIHPLDDIVVIVVDSSKRGLQLGLRLRLARPSRDKIASADCRAAGHL